MGPPPSDPLLTLMHLLLVSLEMSLLPESLLASLADKQPDIEMDGADVPVETALMSKEQATVRTLKGLPLLMDSPNVNVEMGLQSKELAAVKTLEGLPLLMEHSEMETQARGGGERLATSFLGADHWLPPILLDSSLGAGARGSWHRLCLAHVHLALDLAGQLPTVPAQVLIKELNSGEGGAAVRTC